MPIPSKVRAAPKVKEVQDIPSGAHVVFEVSFEREGAEQRVCVAKWGRRNGLKTVFINMEFAG